MTKRKRNSLMRRAVCSKFREEVFERLEPKMMLTVTWGGGGDGIRWSDPLNWTGGVAPVAGDNVVFNSSATVKVDTDYDITHQLGSLTISGNAAVVLDDSIDNGHLDFTGNIVLNQTASAGATLEFGLYQPTANTYTHGAILAADNLVSTGNSSGWSGLIVDGNTDVGLGGDIRDIYNTLFNLSIASNSLMDVSGNSFLQGKGSPSLDPSSIVNNGDFTTTGTLTIGGTGIVNYSTSHLTTAGTINVGHQSEMNINGTVTTNADMNVGDFTGASTSLASGQGAAVMVSGTLTVGNTLHVIGGIGTLVDVKRGHLTVQDLTVDHTGMGGVLHPLVKGPEVLIENSGAAVGSLSVAGTATVGLGDLTDTSGSLVIATGATGTIGTLNVYTNDPAEIGPPVTIVPLPSPFPPAVPVPLPRVLLLDVSGALTVSQANLGRSAGTGGAGGLISISGALTAKSGGTAIEIGDSGPIPTLVFLTGTISSVGAPGVAPGDIRKEIGAIVSTLGGGSIAGPIVHAGGIGGDFAPGDGYALDSNDHLISNGTNSTDAYGTLEIDGDLDAPAGFTLDSVLGSPGTSNLLDVTSTLTLGSDFDGQFRAITGPSVNSTTFSYGDTWTILTAAEIDGLDEDSDPIVGGFGDYTFGDPIIGDRDLPVLADNLYWTLNEVPDGSNTDLQLAVGSMTLLATATNWHTITLATNAPTWFPTHLSIKSGDDTSFHDVSPGYATTISSWTAPSNLYSGQTNSYRVTADIDGQTFWATASATTPISGIRAAAPSSFSATVDGSDSTAIDFYANNGTSTGYDQIQMASAAAPNDWFNLDGPTLTTTATIESGARIFPDMLFRTRLITTDGTHSDASPWSSTVEVDPGDSSAISAPTLTSMVPIPGGYRLTINGVPELSGGGAGSGVYIEDLSDGFDFATGENPQVTMTNASQNATSSTFTVDIAFNTNGPDAAFDLRTVQDGGSPYLESDRETVAAPTISAPGGLGLAMVGRNVSLTWSDGADDETGYTIERLRTNDTTSTWTAIATLPADSVEFLDASVFPSDSYKYRVTATNTTTGITSVVQTDGTPITATSVTVSISGDSSYADNDDGTRDYTLILTSADPDVVASGVISITWGDGTSQIIHGIPADGVLHTYADQSSHTISTALALGFSTYAGETYNFSAASVLYVDGTNGQFSLGSGSTLNLTNKDMIIQSDSANASTLFSTVYSEMASGYASRSWMGTGINSSVAIYSFDYTMGIMLNRDASGNAIYNTFDGVAVDANSILIKYTVVGDFNLDGITNIFDENSVTSHWQQTTGSLYSIGDYNYDGIINIFDLNAVTSHWQDHL